MIRRLAGAALLVVAVVLSLLAQGCAGLPDVNDLGVVLSGHVCISGEAGWQDGEWVAEAEMEACLDEVRMHWAEHYDHTAAVAVCLEIMTADAQPGE